MPRQGAHDPSRTLMATIVAEKNIPWGSALYRRGLAQYRANLRALLKKYRRAGVPVFIGTLVANERDQPPFAGDRAAEHYRRGRALDEQGRYDEARQAYLAAKDHDELRFRAPEAFNDVLRELAAAAGAHVIDVRAAFTRAARDGIVGHDLMLEHLHPNLEGYFVMADAFYEALRARELIGPWTRPIPREVARREIPVTEVDRLYGEYRIHHLTSDYPFSQRQEPFQVGAAHGRIEQIAQRYYQGRYDWPAAMRALLEHYRRSGDFGAAVQVAVLLAEAFPNDFEDQKVAAQLLGRARRPETEVYRRRARHLAAQMTSR